MKERLRKIVSYSSLSLLLGGLFVSFPLETRRQAGRERGWKCEKCGKKYCDCHLLDCHHKNPEHDGGKNNIENLQILCLLCHAETHREMGDEHSANSIMGRFNSTYGGRTREWIKNNA